MIKEYPYYVGVGSLATISEASSAKELVSNYPGWMAVVSEDDMWVATDDEAVVTLWALAGKRIFVWEGRWIESSRRETETL